MNQLPRMLKPALLDALHALQLVRDIPEVGPDAGWGSYKWTGAKAVVGNLIMRKVNTILTYALKYQINNDLTRCEVRASFDYVMREFLATEPRLLADYKVICDETNNPSSQRGPVRVYLFIKPNHMVGHYQFEFQNWMTDAECDEQRDVLIQ